MVVSSLLFFRPASNRFIGKFICLIALFFVPSLLMHKKRGEEKKAKKKVVCHKIVFMAHWHKLEIYCSCLANRADLNEKLNEI